MTMPNAQPLKVNPSDLYAYMWDAYYILKPIVEQQLVKNHGSKWWEKVAYSRGFKFVGDDFLTKPENVFDIVIRFFELFEPVLKTDGRDLIEDLRKDRNPVAHREVDVARAIAIAQSFLTLLERLEMAAPDKAEKIQSIKAKIDAKKEEFETLFLQGKRARHDDPNRLEGLNAEPLKNPPMNEALPSTHVAETNASMSDESAALRPNVYGTPHTPGEPTEERTGVTPGTDEPSAWRLLWRYWLVIVGVVAAVALLLLVNSFDGRMLKATLPLSPPPDGGGNAKTSQPSPSQPDSAETNEQKERRHGGRTDDANKEKNYHALPMDSRGEPVRYLNLVPREAPLVFIVDSATHRIDVDVTDRIATAMHGEGGAFTPAFVTDGLFAKAFQGDASVLRQLKLFDVPMVVLGTKESNVTTEPSVDPDYKRGLTTLTVRVYIPRSGFSSRSFAVDAKGPGFVSIDAVRAADSAAVEKVLARLKENP